VIDWIALKNQATAFAGRFTTIGVPGNLTLTFGTDIVVDRRLVTGTFFCRLFSSVFFGHDNVDAFGFPHNGEFP
jgi:hypothetical protein